jgi:putative Holliday junction resolvase
MQSVDVLGRVLGVDLGEARIGLACSDPLQMLATPIEVLKAAGTDADADAVAAAAARHEVVAIVLGLPLDRHGQPGAQAEKTLAFAEALRARTALPVHTMDERFTTVIAHQVLRASGVKSRRQRAQVDKVAAAQLLQTWLDRNAAQRRMAGS